LLILGLFGHIGLIQIFKSDFWDIYDLENSEFMWFVVLARSSGHKCQKNGNLGKIADLRLKTLLLVRIYAKKGIFKQIHHVIAAKHTI
jgi:hypothetical protein